MSDPEAGGLEGGENPDPEDDAHLSAHSDSIAAGHAESTQPLSSQAEVSGDDAHLSSHSDSVATGHAESTQPLSSQAKASEENCFIQAEAGDSQPEQTGAGVPGVMAGNCGDLGQLEQTGTVVLGMDDEDQAACAKLLADSSGGKSGDEVEEKKAQQQLAQLEWPPESDRCSEASCIGDVFHHNRQLEEDTTGISDQATVSLKSDDPVVLSLQRNDKAGVCRTRREPVNHTDNSNQEPVSHVLTGYRATDNSDLEPVSHVFTGDSATENYSQESQSHVFIEGSATDNSGQEESPPEDKAFAAGVSLAHVQSSGAIDEQNDVDVGCSYADLDHNTNSADTGNVEAPSSSTTTQVAQVSTAGGKAEKNSCKKDGPDQSVSHLQGFQCISVVPCKIAEKEDDQSPECDRELSPHLSSSQSSQAAPCGTDGAALSAQAHPSHLYESAQSGGLGTVLNSSLGHCAESCEVESVSKQGEGICDSSSECDSTWPVLSSTSSQPPSASRMMLATSDGRSSLLKPSFLSDDSEDEDLLTELDAELHVPCSPSRQKTDMQGVPVCLSLNGLKEVDPKNSEMCKQFEEQLLKLQETVLQREREIHR